MKGPGHRLLAIIVPVEIVASGRQHGVNESGPEAYSQIRRRKAAPERDRLHSPVLRDTDDPQRKAVHGLRDVHDPQLHALHVAGHVHHTELHTAHVTRDIDRRDLESVNLAARKVDAAGGLESLRFTPDHVHDAGALRADHIAAHPVEQSASLRSVEARADDASHAGAGRTLQVLGGIGKQAGALETGQSSPHQGEAVAQIDAPDLADTPVREGEVRIREIILRLVGADGIKSLHRKIVPVGLRRPGLFVAGKRRTGHGRNEQCRDIHLFHIVLRNSYGTAARQPMPERTTIPV